MINNIFVFEREYMNDKKMEKEKYNYNNELIIEGEYKNVEKWVKQKNILKL